MKDKVVIITGGTSGIGFASAKLFLENNAKVIIIGRDQVKGEAATIALRAVGDSVEFIRCDLSKVSECQNIVKKIIDNYHKVDVLINNAGLYYEKAIMDMSEADFDEMMNINIKAAYFMAKEVAIQMKKQQSGAIVNISSDAGINGNFLCTAYCASKGALTVFSKALALELAPYHIRVNCVCPGDIDTPLTQNQFSGVADKDKALEELAQLYPLGRIGKATEVANVIYFLASEQASFVVGATWSVDGGISSY